MKERGIQHYDECIHTHLMMYTKEGGEAICASTTPNTCYVKSRLNQYEKE